ncbi:MAG: glycoside hydrolase family 88 protein [Lachnospiraceae bacterium]|nr:glycoside hydrolase family 88 protein [Lachnospiraceae bacterium]
MDWELNKKDKAWLAETADKLKAKLAWVSEKSKEKIPFIATENGEHDNMANSNPDWWTNGFWAGMLWLMYHETGEERYAEIARFSEKILDGCLEQYLVLHHDVGFMWLHTSVADYRLTGREEAKRRGLHAANILAGRFNPAGRFIRAWNDRFEEENGNKGWAIIDCMMNIPLLYWASDVTHDPHFRQIAMLHADTAMANFIRPDGSVCHIVEFDPYTGAFVKSYGGQGYAEGSSWTRGQSWALYGFALSYLHTGKQEYLDTAKKVAHYFIANIPEDGLVPVDFRQPKEPDYRDSTANAIAACGLIEIARHVPEYEKDMYLNAALRLLKALDTLCCRYDEGCDYIVGRGTGAYHDAAHEYPIIYGDYFYLEAIFKLNGSHILLW